MNILMATNTFSPHVGGVANSVSRFAAAFRSLGHATLVIAPTFQGVSSDEEEVVRIPAVQHFSGSDFSVPVPVPGRIHAVLRRFRPDIVHSHHPFLLGDTALRVAAALDIPVVFTHHTMYERYTHYVPGDSERMKRFAIELVTGYCNLCDAVVSPSETVAGILPGRGVRVPIEVIPTGVDLERFRSGNGSGFRKEHGIPFDAWVIGHAGRLAPEKNLDFLSRAVASYLELDENARFLIAGEGPSRDAIRSSFERRGLGSRLHLVGMLSQETLPSAYAAMDVFAFASQTETQGMVLAEAMAAGVMVVAVDASGVREVVRDGFNGRLLPSEDEETFLAGLKWARQLPRDVRVTIERGVDNTAVRFSMVRSARLALDLYERLLRRKPSEKAIDRSAWAGVRRRLREEIKIVGNIVHAATDAALPHEEGK